MNELDEKIRQALDTTGIDTTDLGGDDEDSLRSLIGDAYRGRLRWIYVLTTFWQLVFFAVFVYAGVRFFRDADAGEPILWATVFLMAGLGVSVLKLLHWMAINRNRLLREIKRLELEVARLASRLGGR